MNQKVNQAIERLSKHLREKKDVDGLAILSELLAAMAEGEGDILRKRA